MMKRMASRISRIRSIRFKPRMVEESGRYTDFRSVYLSAQTKLHGFSWLPSAIFILSGSRGSVGGHLTTKRKRLKVLDTI